jgi:hypothetical protein
VGSSSDGRLIYGYDLDGESWAIEETGEYGELALDWYDNDDEDSPSFTDACLMRLLASIGITENPHPGKYFDTEKLVKEHFGVEFIGFGDAVYGPGACALGTVDIWASGYSTAIVDLADLAAAPEREGWDAKLQHACEVLGITPKQAKPAWILTSSYG